MDYTTIPFAMGRDPRHIDDLEHPDPHQLSQRRALQTLQGDRLMLYAMRTSDGLIKIGCSSNVAQRHYEFGKDFLALRFGDFDDEAATHERLKPHRARGREQYHPVEAVLAVVNEMRAEFGQPPLTG